MYKRQVGDYDIDGVCSTYLLYRGISRCRGLVDYQIPERIRDGYGINENIIRKAAADGIDTIVTCDNGIAALDQIALAKELGLTVVVTDHHEVVRGADGSEQLPCADAVVNPKQDGCSYPFKSICGGVVAYKLVQVLFERFGIPETEWEQMQEIKAEREKLEKEREESKVMMEELMHMREAIKEISEKAVSYTHLTLPTNSRV